MENETTVDGIHQLNPAAHRLKRAVAFAVVALPFLGLVGAAALAWRQGLRALDLGLLLAMYTACMLGVTVGFHRYFAHHAFSTSQPMRLLLGIAGSMAGQGPLLFWVATHRAHHSYSDRPGDPHSPHVHGDVAHGMLHGLWHAHIGWMFTRDLADWVRFSPDLMRDPLGLWLHRTYALWVLLGLALPAAAGGLWTGTWMGALTGFLWGGLVRMFLVNQALWCVGSICHFFGRQPFATKDHSANNYWVALFTFGEGLQNNHHAFPGAAAHAVRWWEPDLSAWVLRALAAAGLVWDLRAPSPRSVRMKLREGT